LKKSACMTLIVALLLSLVSAQFSQLVLGSNSSREGYYEKWDSPYVLTRYAMDGRPIESRIYSSPQVVWNGTEYVEYIFKAISDSEFQVRCPRVTAVVKPSGVEVFSKTSGKVAEADWELWKIERGKAEKVGVKHQSFMYEKLEDSVRIVEFRLMDDGSELNIIHTFANFGKYTIEFRAGEDATYRLVWNVEIPKASTYKKGKYSVALYGESNFLLSLNWQKARDFYKDIRLKSFGKGEISIAFLDRRFSAGETFSLDPTYYSEPTLDGQITKCDDYYPPTTTSVDTDMNFMHVGQSKSDPPYYYFTIYRSYVSFNTSGIPDDVVIESATLHLYCISDYSDTDFTIEVYGGSQPIYGDSLDSGDWGCGTSYQSGVSTSTFDEPEEELSFSISPYQINVQGRTQFEIRSSREGTQPSGDEYVELCTGDYYYHPPYLTVSYTTEFTPSQEQIQAAVAYLESHFNSTLELLWESEEKGQHWLLDPEAEGGGFPEYEGKLFFNNTYWVYSDNLFAFHALEPHNPVLAERIQAAYMKYEAKGGRSYLFESLFGEDIPDVIAGARNIMIDTDEESYFIVLRQHTAPITFNVSEFGDMCIYKALDQYWQGNTEEAEDWFFTAYDYWDGKGIADSVFYVENSYVNYKLALVLYAARILGLEDEINFEHMEWKLWHTQRDDNGGFRSRTDSDGNPYGSANVEATALALLIYNDDLINELKSYPFTSKPRYREVKNAIVDGRKYLDWLAKDITYQGESYTIFSEYPALPFSIYIREKDEWRLAGWWHSAPGSWMYGFEYRKSHVIEGSSCGELTNYTVRIIVHYGNGTDEGEHVYLGGECREDFADVRFTNETGIGELKYWIEEKVDGDYAVFWVKIPYIPRAPDSTLIYIYYGKEYSISTSTGEGTFLFFDDFDDGVIDSDKWTTTTDASSYTLEESNGWITLSCSDNDEDGGRVSIKSADAVFTGSLIWEMKLNITGSTANKNVRDRFYIQDEAGVRILPHDYGIFDNPGSGRATPVVFWDGFTSTEVSTSINLRMQEIWTDTIFTWRILNYDSGSLIYENSETVELNGYNYIYVGATKDPNKPGTSRISIDWLFIRKYADPEPSHGSWSAPQTYEETVNSPVCLVWHEFSLDTREALWYSFETDDDDDYGEPLIYVEVWHNESKLWVQVDPSGLDEGRTVDIYLGSHMLFTHITNDMPTVDDWFYEDVYQDLRSHRYTVRHGVQKGYKDALTRQLVERAERCKNLIDDYGFTYDIYDPLFFYGREWADNYFFTDQAYHDVDVYGQLPRGLWFYPYWSKVGINRHLYILESHIDPLVRGLQAIHLLNKYGDPDKQVDGVSARSIARWIEKTYWNGYGVTIPFKSKEYASGVRTAVFLELETLLGYKYGDNTSKTYADKAAKYLVMTQWPMSGWGLVELQGAIPKTGSLWSSLALVHDQPPHGGKAVRPLHGGGFLVAYRVVNNEVWFGVPPAGIIGDLIDLLGMPAEYDGLIPTNQETTFAATRALEVYLQYAFESQGDHDVSADKYVLQGFMFKNAASSDVKYVNTSLTAGSYTIRVTAKSWGDEYNRVLRLYVDGSLVEEWTVNPPDFDGSVTIQISSSGIHEIGVVLATEDYRTPDDWWVVDVSITKQQQ